MTVIPAAPGFYVNGEGTTLPVVGWYVPEGSEVARPIVAVTDTDFGELVFPAPSGVRGKTKPNGGNVSDLDVPISYGTEVYKKRTYWRCQDGPLDFLLTLPPHTPMPNDSRVHRIMRAAFFDLRRDLNVFEVGPTDAEPDGMELI